MIRGLATGQPLAQPLIERVVIENGGLEIVWRDQSWRELAGELMPGTIGAEPLEPAITRASAIAARV